MSVYGSFLTAHARARLRSAFIALLLLLFPAYAAAEGRQLTIDEAYDLAMRNHEAVAIAGENVNIAKADLGRAVSRILPSLTVEGFYTRYTAQKTAGPNFVVQPDSTTGVDVKLSQPLYSGGREWAAQRQAKLQIQSTKEGLEGTREDVMLNTGRAFYNVLKAGKDIEIKRAALKRAGERLNVADARFKVGEVTKSAVLRAQAELAGAESELTKSLNALDNAVETLKRLTGIEGLFTPVEPAPQPAVALNAEDLVNTALQSRYDYRQRQLEEKAASEDITIAWAGYKPSLKLEGQYSWRNQDPQTTFLLENTTSGTVRITYPIFEGFLRRAELSQARSRFKEAELRRLSLRRDIEVQVREAANNLKAIDSLIESFRRQVAFAEEDYKMVFEQFKFGVATTLDVIDADTTLVSAQRSLSSAVYDLEVAKLNLKYVIGTLIEGASK